MTVEVFEVGDVKRLVWTVTDAAGAPADPTAVTFRMREPDGTVTEYSSADSPATIVNSAVGTWYVEWTIDQKGFHAYEFTGQGSNAASENSVFYVRKDDV